jgi:hypothetical protein
MNCAEDPGRPVAEVKRCKFTAKGTMKLDEVICHHFQMQNDLKDFWYNIWTASRAR